MSKFKTLAPMLSAILGFVAVAAVGHYDEPEPKETISVTADAVEETVATRELLLIDYPGDNIGTCPDVTEAHRIKIVSKVLNI